MLLILKEKFHKVLKIYYLNISIEKKTLLFEQKEKLKKQLRYIVRFGLIMSQKRYHILSL